MRGATLQAPDTTLRQEIVRRASAKIWVIAVSLGFATFCGGFLALAFWAALRTGEDLTMPLSSVPGLIAGAGLVFALAMAFVGFRGLRQGDTVALVLAPEGVALPEQSVPTLPWPHVIATDRTYGRGASLRLFFDDHAARKVRPHAILRFYARVGNLHARDALSIARPGLTLELDQLLALIRAYASAHGGPQST
ncbi:MAG: hypothetical protein HC783_15400 [Rhodobacteraceae bacterium]|nr:hypothetical protein [Paracoccaceae bacterium]